MLFTKTSLFSGIQRTRNIEITEDQLNNWQNGELIQFAMPNLTDEEREFIMTGMTKEDWEQLYAVEEQ